MAQFNSLLVTGDSRFINPINGNARNGVYYVKGTQTAATGSWTGVIPVPALYDGLTIMYYLPYAGSGNATLNLTLSDGTTTGAINCYFRKTERLTTHFPSGSSIVMTYHPAGSIKYDGTATTDNRWVVNASYLDGNDGAYYDREIYVRATTGSNGIFPYTLLMRLPDGRWESIVTSSSTGTGKARNTHGFLFGQLAYIGYNETFAENAVISDYRLWTRYTNLVDYRYSLNLVNNATQGFTGNKPIYLVGSIGNDGLFYIDANMWAKALPSSADGKIYMYIGDAVDWYRATFYGSSSFKAYVYTNGHIREYAQDAATVNGQTIANLPAQSGGTAVSLVTTGEKYLWNNASGSSGNKIFTVQPTPPYSVGDLWIAEDNNILVCIVARASGSFDSDDWGSAVDAVSTEELQNSINGAISDTLTVITGASAAGGNVMLRLDANRVPYELLVTDTPTNIASNTAKIYRWDGNGLRFSSTGYSGPYSTLINTSGQIPANYLTGNLNASVVAIQNFTASMVHGGILSRGRANNQDGTIEVYDTNGTIIAEVTNLGFKFYGQGTGADRPYYLVNTSGFIGYTKVNGTWTQTVKVAFDEFRMIKGYVRDELDIGGQIKLVPMTTSTNSGIAFVAVT